MGGVAEALIRTVPRPNASGNTARTVRAIGNIIGFFGKTVESFVSATIVDSTAGIASLTAGAGFETWAVSVAGIDFAVVI